MSKVWWWRADAKQMMPVIKADCNQYANGSSKGVVCQEFVGIPIRELTLQEDKWIGKALSE